MSGDQEILALEEKRLAAMIARDFGKLESMKSGRVKYQKASCTEQKVRVFGEVALVTGRASIDAEIGGQAKTLRLLFLNAWTRTPQGWKFVAWQSTPLPS